MVRHFPPLTLAQLKAQRAVLLNYSLSYPVRAFSKAHFCFIFPPRIYLAGYMAVIATNTSGASCTY